MSELCGFTTAITTTAIDSAATRTILGFLENIAFEFIRNRFRRIAS